MGLWTGRGRGTARLSHPRFFGGCGAIKRHSGTAGRAMRASAAGGWRKWREKVPLDSAGSVERFASDAFWI